MSTLDNNIENKPSKDPIDQLIYEKNFRIKLVLPVKVQDSLIVFLNNGKHISVHLSSFPRLKNASQKQLDAWALISNGIGIEWPEIDEDLSLKGLVKEMLPFSRWEGTVTKPSKRIRKRSDIQLNILAMVLWFIVTGFLG